ncbi:hypothetical protein PSHT_02233 [Puccinia striiformis]|uniref:Uncharacterized protein n=1 Tax=Puccinia striiformis TaxID=27350 RepID=A0A2S4WIH6_9BASI|nr:hypothetical protein PSHT_02233 [Puccinia striiformis]
MHSDKSLTVQFVCNHLTQFSNETKAEIRESSSSTQAALVSTRNQKSGRNGKRGGQGNSGGNGPKRCTAGYHNPKQDVNHSADSCWHLHPDKAPDWWQEAWLAQSVEHLAFNRKRILIEDLLSKEADTLWKENN